MRLNTRFWLNSAALPSFFGLKILSGIFLLKVSSYYLNVEQFSAFSQFMLFSGMLNMIAVGGAQNGIIREAAAAGEGGALARIQSASLAIWLAAFLLIGGPVVLLSPQVSDLLIGSTAQAWAVLPIVLLTFLGGPGQVFTSILTGRRRTGVSLASQAAGILVATAAATALLRHDDAIGAAVAFAVGPTVTMLVSAAFIRSHRLRFLLPHDLWVEIKSLIGFSGAFLALALFSALTFFGLRFVYREEYGEAALGLWMAANRISDTSIQLLALFVTQIFLPRYAATTEPESARRLLVRCWTIAAATLASFLALFSLAPDFFVRLFLSEHFVPAIPGIQVYMFGDILRTLGVFAMYVAFARGRLWLFMLTESATVTLMAALVLVLIGAGSSFAPYLGYAIAYGGSAIVIVALFFLTRPSRRANNLSQQP